MRARARHEAARRPAGSHVAAQGRHASVAGDGLGRLLGWTTAGAILPGLGFLAAGRRRLGTVLLGLVGLVTVAGVALVASGAITDLGLKAAVRPKILLAIAVLAILVGLLWSAVIVGGHWALRRVRYRPSQNLLSGVLVVALVAGVIVPTGTIARYALAQRGVVLNVFKGGENRDPNLAAPDVKAKDPWAKTPRVNVLLIGSDAGANRTGTRPDTLIVASIDTKTGNTVLFSLPRNLQKVPFPEGSPGARAWPNGFNCGNECLINAVWTWAEEHKDLFPGDPQPGLTATRQAASAVLGLSVDYYALVNLRGFQDVVNAMGGVELNVERPLPIGRSDKYLQPGRRVLNGYDALWYARSRRDSSDYDRMKRQRCLIGAAIDQADPVKLALAFPQLAASAQRNVETDIPSSHLDAFVQLAMRIKDAKVTSLAFTDEVIRPANPDYQEIRAAVKKAVADTEKAPATSKPKPKPTATASPGATATSTPSPTSSKSDTEAPVKHPERAQDLADVCG
ncbi:MAG TPA: LCP family protein [Actinomycetales bacterium]|nr:LCP family protein [Actinomycetales bacterium]